MEIKSFEAFSMRDAIKSVKKNLGADAVILSTREKSVPGQDNAKVYEVTAAAMNESKSLGASAASTRQPQLSDGKFDNLLIGLSEIKDSSATKDQVHTLTSGLKEIKILLLEALRGKEGSVLKDLPPKLADIYRQLRIMEIDETYTTEVIKYLSMLPSPEDTEDEAEYYRDHAIRWMLKRTKIAPQWPIMAGNTAIHVVVGTTGVGKSSVVAKLAAQYHLKKKSNVLVVSFDNKRLAASDQMRIYTKILGVSFTTIDSAESLPDALKQYPDAELVLIDTAGRPAKSDSLVEDLEELKSSILPVDFHLCLSTTEKHTQCDEAIRKFSALGIQSLIFTKLDESWSHGEIFNLSRKWSLPISYFAIGQDIPEDIERASRERVIERIFGL